MKSSRARLAAGSGVAAAAVGLVAAGLAAGVGTPATAAVRPESGQAARPASTSTSHRAQAAVSTPTTTPIKHVVVIFDENVSYDHYFATYPKAANSDGVTFTGAANTPNNRNLDQSGLLTTNPNQYQPFRLTPSQALTCDQNHAYGPEQQAFNGGAMNLFVQKVSKDTCTGLYGAPGLTMGYYDGNTVTGLWNYAQGFAMNDNSFSSTFGPSTPGALNLIAGQTHGFTEVDPTTLSQVATPGSYTLASPDADGVGTVINDPDPAFDDCSDTNHTSSNTLAMAHGRNIGDLLNEKDISWGWFQGGFRPTTAAAQGTYAVCGTTHPNIGGASSADYSPHHSPFQYYASTSNPHHLAPTSPTMVGSTDQANHNYDLSDFEAALNAGVMPAVSFLKAPEYQDGHAAYSDPIDEQHFLVKYINLIERSKMWKDTAIVIAYDDSDGWYDHVAPPVLNSSHDAAQDTSICKAAAGTPAGGYQDRCGPGTRVPLMVLSPYAKQDYVAHNLTEQASVLKFIEDNWSTGRIGDSSFDERSGLLTSMFDFAKPRNYKMILHQNGSVAKVGKYVFAKKSKH